MSIRSLATLAVCGLIAALLYLILGQGPESPDDSQQQNDNAEVEQVIAADALDNQQANIIREDTSSAKISGDATAEFYFHSEAGIDGGSILLNDEVHVFEGNYYKLKDLAAGRHTIRVLCENHQRAHSTFSLEESESKTIDINLDLAATISGRVIDHQGNAVVGASVAALEDVVDDSLYSLALADFFNYGTMPDWASDSSTTDENGEFVMSNLKFANFNVLVSHSEFLPFKTTTATKLDSIENSQIETIQLQQGANLEITVIGQDTIEMPSAWAEWRPNSILASTVIQRKRKAPQFSADKYGVIEIFALPPEILSLNVGADGFATQKIDVDLSEISAGQIHHITVTLSHGFSIYGLVLNADKQPCADSEVALINEKDFSVEAAVSAIKQSGVEVAEDGSFSFENLSPSQYRIVAAAPNYSRHVSQPFTLADANIDDIEITLVQGAKLVVTALDSDNVPKTGLNIAAVSVNASNYANQETDDNGVATFENLSPGNYQVASVDAEANQGADVQFKFVELIDNQTTEVLLGGKIQTALVKGKVSKSGEAIKGARVSVITSSGAKVAATNAEGIYQFDEMPLGEFILIVQANSGLNGNTSFYDSINVNRSGEVTHDIELPDAGLEVYVTAKGDGSAVTQVPVAVRPLNGTNISGGDFSLTDAEGVAKFPSLGDGEYMVSVGVAAASFISPQDNGLGSTIVSDISIRNGMGMQRVDVSLGKGATVKVQVSDQGGDFLPGAHLHYLDSNGQPMNIISLTGTNSKGVAQLTGLPAGPGRIMVRHPEIGMSEFEVNLSDGETFKQRVTLDRGTKLMVTVVDENDAPLSGVLCTALDHRGAALSYVWALSETQATQTAYFSGTAQKLGPLPVGNYKIQLIRPGKELVIHDVYVNGESVQNLRLRFAPE
ncbi:MAG: carboxypeptidase-like regulatory domain-containing protein [Planctomycetota bacterium]|jgi:hypothetical protein|nr:carboxypeptidase-like regulatory domain-containing protein [Planctomycetota bacterium]